MFDEVINNLHNYIFKSDNTYSYIDCDKHITWLKSLKEGYTWKPSEGQMEAMENLIINIIRNPLLLDNYTQSNIRSLCNDLRKLVIIR